MSPLCKHVYSQAQPSTGENALVDTEDTAVMSDTCGQCEHLIGSGNASPDRRLILLFWGQGQRHLTSPDWPY